MDQQQQEMARRNLHALCIYLDPTYEIILGIHDKIFKFLNRILKGEIKRWIINLPPWTGKSKIVSQNLPAFLLWQNPKERVITCSYWEELAWDMSRNAKKLVTSEEYKRVFNTKLGEKKEWLYWETSEWGYYYATWVWWALTGKRFTFGVIDDPVKDREQAESEAYMERLYDWYYSTFRTRRLNQDTPIVLMMTRWSENDLVGKLIEDMQDGWEKWEQLVIPAIDEDWKELIRPWKRDEWFWEKEKDIVPPREFAALYQQDPIWASANIFKREDLRYFVMSDFENNAAYREQYKKDDMLMGMFVDPAFSSSASSDDAAVIIAWQHKITKEVFVFDVYSDTSAPSKTYNAMFNMADISAMNWLPLDFISIEQVNLSKQQTKFKKDFMEEMATRGKYYRLIDYNPVGKKEERIKRMEYRFTLHQVKWRKDDTNNQNRKKMEKQLLSFPESKKVDIIDCHAQVLDTFTDRGLQSEKQQQEKKKKREKIRRQNTINPFTWRNLENSRVSLYHWMPRWM